LARQPAVPFPDNQVSQIPLFHFLRAQKWLEPGKRAQVVALVLRASSTMAPLARAPTESPFDVRMQQGRHWTPVQSTSWNRSQREGTAAAAPIPAGNHHTRTLSISQGSRAVFCRPWHCCNVRTFRVFRTNSTGLITC
jgi:hypothetical protein